MANINIKGENPVDTEKRKEALQYLNKNATTEELEKLVKLSKNPLYRQMLNNVN